jgi:hypothetical protein
LRAVCLALFAPILINLINSAVLIFSGQLNRRKKFFFIFGSAGGVLALVGMVVFFEPFAPRYKGKTVNQWVNYYSGRFAGPDAEIIAAFGTNALSTLISRKDPPLWVGPAMKIQKLMRRSNGPWGYSGAGLRGPNTARIWGVSLMEINTPLEINLLRDNPDDSYVIAVFDLTFNFGLNGGNKLQKYLNYPEESVRTRAARLLKKSPKQSWVLISKQRRILN